jgi:PAS domain S-box-containing protein
MGGTRLRVLVVDDDEEDYLVVSELLASVPSCEYELEWVRDYQAAVKALCTSGHDVSLLDYRLGDRTGLELLQEVFRKGCKTPIIFLTGEGDYRVDLEAMKAGAADYLLKEELNASLLERSIRYAVERKQADETLRKSEERFRFLAENTRDALYRLKYDSMTYDYLSPAIETLTGYCSEELIKIGFSCLVKRIDIPGVEDVSPAVIVRDREEGKIGEFQAEYRIVTKNGDLKWLRDHSSPWRDDSGCIIGSVGVLSDITERKQAEEALRNSEKQQRLLSAKLLTLQEEERACLSAELHDRIGQTLVAIKVNLERALGTDMEKTGLVSASLLEHLIPMIQNVLGEVRNIYMNIRPTVLDDLGIVAAVDYLCREFEDMHPTININKLISTKPNEIPEHIRIVIYRIVQEALNNAARHGKPESVSVSLVKEQRNIKLKIKDNGVGFDVKQVLDVENRESGLGIASMKERSELSNGSFAIVSAVGQGTTVCAWWPYED